MARVARTRLTLIVLAVLLLPAGAAAGDGPAVGDPAPAFELPRLDGEGTLGTADFEGDWLYVDFWASWCAPCRDSFPWMNRLADGGAPGDLRIVAVGLDRERADAEAFLRRYPADFPVVWDGDWTTPEAYGVETMPSSYLIGPDGTVRFVHRGFREKDAARLREALAATIRGEQP